MEKPNDRQIRCERLVVKAIEKFNKSEQYLISRDLSERCICARFSRYLENELSKFHFGEYTVDVEYNRGNEAIESDPKTLKNKKIVVDLIVHKRGFDEENGFDNLICIEMKKDYKRLNLEPDKERLRNLVNYRYRFCYEAGFMIVIHSDTKQQKYELRIESSYFEHDG